MEVRYIYNIFYNSGMLPFCCNIVSLHGRMRDVVMHRAEERRIAESLVSRTQTAEESQIDAARHLQQHPESPSNAGRTGPRRGPCPESAGMVQRSCPETTRGAPLFADHAHVHSA
jgi:hypothetical protein